MRARRGLRGRGHHPASHEHRRDGSARAAAYPDHLPHFARTVRVGPVPAAVVSWVVNGGKRETGNALRVALLTSARSWRGSGTSLANIARGLGEHGHTVQPLATTPAVTTGFAAARPPGRGVPIPHTGPPEARGLL